MLLSLINQRYSEKVNSSNFIRNGQSRFRSGELGSFWQ